MKEKLLNHEYIMTHKPKCMSDLDFKVQIDRNQKFIDMINDEDLQNRSINEYKSRASEDHWDDNF